MEYSIFVSREAEIARLAAFFNRALAGKPQVVFVSGEAGSGKTALLSEFLRTLQEKNTQCVAAWGTCSAHTGVGDPFHVFRRVLEMLTGHVALPMAKGAASVENSRRLEHVVKFTTGALLEFGPDLIELFLPGMGLVTKVGAFIAGEMGLVEKVEKKLAKPLTAAGEIEQSQIFEQFEHTFQAFARRKPLLIVIDDLQWADLPSISLLFHLVRNLQNCPVMLVGTYRPGEINSLSGADRHPLEKTLSEFKRMFGDIFINLDAAAEATGSQFVDAYVAALPNRFPADFRDRLYEKTRGYPLFTTELIRDLHERGMIGPDEGGVWSLKAELDWEKLPARVEGVIEERIARLEENLRELLSIASVEGEAFTAQVIARVRAVQERQTLRELSVELEKRYRLVKELGEEKTGAEVLSHYEFSHALFQQYLYAALSAGERRILHRQVAEILEELYRNRLDEVVVQLARHAFEADDEEKAVQYLLRAGDRARALTAYREAAAHYEQAEFLLRQARKYDQAARVWMKLGLTYHLAFDFARSRAAFEQGFLLWSRWHVAPVQGAFSQGVLAGGMGRTLRVDWPYPPITLDPALAADVDSAGVVEQLFSGLAALTPEMDVMPCLAEHWQVSEDGRDYRFTLKPGLFWSDGSPLTAEDAAFAFRRLLDPGFGAPTAELFSMVAEGGVSAPDARTLLIRLKQPAAHFLYLAASHAAFPVPKAFIEARGEEWAQSFDLPASGPFVLAQTGEGCLALERNPHYHGARRGNIHRLELITYEDEARRAAAYETDELDTLFLWNPGQERDLLRQRHAGEYLSLPWLSTAYIAFRCDRPPFADPRVRQAFAQSIDRERFAGVQMQGYVFPADGGLVPPGMPGHSPASGLPYDLPTARRLLADAGYSGGVGLPEIEFWSEEGKESSCRALAREWSEALGVRVTPVIVDYDSFTARLDSDPPPLFLEMWYADYPDPASFLADCPAVRWTGWRSQIFTRLLENARTQQNPAARLELYQRADRLMAEKAVVLPLVYWRTHLLLKGCVKAFPTSAVKWWYFQDVVVE